MEAWHKYSLQLGDGSVMRPEFGPDFDSQAEFMGGYDENAAYSDLYTFRQVYARGRYQIWDTFIREHVNRDARILSIASGRGINELLLQADGFRVTCSDLKVPACHAASLALFGQHDYLVLDILRQEPPHEFDALICLSLIYLFDEQALDAFFQNVSAALPLKGRLILDAAGSEQSVLGSLYHRGFLKWEAWAHYWLRKAASAANLSRFRYSLVDRHFGYRWKTKEILALAKCHRLRLVHFAAYDPETDLRRSHLLGKILDKPQSRAARALVEIFGNRLRYLRLFAFEKEG